MNESARLRILFVDGDERQARATSRLDEDPALAGVDVTYIHPSWTRRRNWNKPLAEVRRRVGDVDIVVLTADLPTLLGAAIRRVAGEAGVPWRSARIRGRLGITRAIVAAATEVRAQRAVATGAPSPIAAGRPAEAG